MLAPWVCVNPYSPTHLAVHCCLAKERNYMDRSWELAAQKPVGGSLEEKRSDVLGRGEERRSPGCSTRPRLLSGRQSPSPALELSNNLRSGSRGKCGVYQNDAKGEALGLPGHHLAPASAMVLGCALDKRCLVGGRRGLMPCCSSLSLSHGDEQTNPALIFPKVIAAFLLLFGKLDWCRGTDPSEEGPGVPGKRRKGN